ncbi:hypothetical protein [Brevibacterium aurantiacum]|uniref:Uncharacterized protein n=1 Tax=Brevibacterium aurantiacum TaxID=273384 RepID=A0A2H1KCF5_BREAU|nr:hypothetical protein [Brevibacterium aurantiacum]MDN5595069.1 hypothetical protein [Brevibacterium sp.]SMX75480.1 hypothetical protein BAURA86_00622 [Brevibacterium aurantiacum]SMX97495.1 hypothetical protein BAURA63_03193 [Brevibacterium aurantiacum]
MIHSSRSCCPDVPRRIRTMRKRVLIIVLAVIAVLGLIAGMLGGTPT